MTMFQRPTIGIVGGTGALGAALGKRWARAGYGVLLGSREPDKARTRAQALSDEEHLIAGATNAEAASRAEIVVVTVPFAVQETILSEIRTFVQSKIVVDTTVPLRPPKVMQVQLPPEGSAAMRAQRLLGENVHVVSAFHTVAAHKLAREEKLDADVLVFGDKREWRDPVVTLAAAAGLRGLHGGALANSAAAEALTSVLIFLNKTYKIDGAGLKITGDLLAPA